MNPFYKDYAEYLGKFFPGRKVQKISVNAGFSCPNRDGRIGRGGCIYCSNRSFTPSYCFGASSVNQQLEKGKEFFARKYPRMEYLAYFQSYTNTYDARPAELERLYMEAAETSGIVGIAVATRPDCIPEGALDVLAKVNRTIPLFVELGVETMKDDTLRIINRGHTSRDTEQAIKRLADRGLHVGVHLIVGLPGEDFSTSLETLDRITALPVESIKFHHLQILRDTPLAEMTEKGEIAVARFSADEYLDHCVRIVERVPERIAIERFLASAPPEDVVYPKWGLKNHEFVAKLLKRLSEKGVRRRKIEI